jgi:dTDP-4-amino-4,6-dideoxygalactose transaminase
LSGPAGEETADRGTLIPLADVRLPPAAIDAARRVLEGGWLSSGPEVERFEAAVAERVGAEHAVACNSCTAAIQLSLAGLGIGSGDEVIMPSLSFVAGANVAVELGAEPVFCDIVAPDELTLDPRSVERLVTERTRAVIPMHYGGHPCDPAILDVAAKAGIAVIEDAAHAIGAAGAPGECGTWGVAGCYSFFANKNLPLGEGGMLVTSDGELAERARALRSHGMTAATWVRHKGHASSYDVTVPGYNQRLDEVRAAMGTVLLGELEARNGERATRTARYASLLGEVDGLSVPFGEPGEGERRAHHIEVVVLDEGVERDRVRAELLEAGVQTSVHYPPTHTFAAHQASTADVAVTDSVAPRLLTLPLYPHMEDAQVDRVVELLASALKASA